MSTLCHALCPQKEIRVSPSSSSCSGRGVGSKTDLDTRDISGLKDMMFVSVPQGGDKDMLSSFGGERGHLQLGEIRKVYLEEWALENEGDLEMGAEVPGSGTPEANREAERLESVGTPWCLMWSELRSYLRLGDMWGRRDGPSSGVGVALSANPRRTQRRVGFNNTSSRICWKSEKGKLNIP